MDHVTEQRPVPGPIVYGYLWLGRTRPNRQEALRGALADYCVQHELALACVFTERHGHDGGSAAFTGLLDALAAVPGAYGVLLPARNHLGPAPTAVQREQQLVNIGARLLLIRHGCAARLFQPATPNWAPA